jgi:hypothetical protein
MAVAAVVPITPEQVRNLAALDLWLEAGPKYVRNAVVGAAVGGLLGYYKISKRDPSHAGRYALIGAGATIAAGFIFFQVAKWASKKEHETVDSAALAVTPSSPPVTQAKPAAPSSPVVTKGYFAGAQRALYPTMDAPHAYR